MCSSLSERICAEWARGPFANGGRLLSQVQQHGAMVFVVRYGGDVPCYISGSEPYPACCGQVQDIVRLYPRMRGLDQIECFANFQHLGRASDDHMPVGKKEEFLRNCTQLTAAQPMDEDLSGWDVDLFHVGPRSDGMKKFQQDYS